MSQKDLDELLELWNNTKIKINDLEKKCEKYKLYCEKLMNKNNKDIIIGTNYSVVRNNITRSSVSKKDLPTDIWNKYSSTCSYPSYYLKKNK